MPEPEESSPEMEGSGGPLDEPESETGGNAYRKAGRTIRHAMIDGDDEALAEAICDLVDIHGSKEPDEESAGEKPNLAMLLLKGKKK
jgi:hypothetical protein